MKALVVTLAIMLAASIALSLAYKNKVQEYDRHIKHLEKGKIGSYEIGKAPFTEGTNQIRILDNSDRLVLTIEPLHSPASGKIDLAATNLLIRTKHLPRVDYSNEVFLIRFP